ncbi:MAG TPA: hypothetical protein VGH80_13925 [Xanthomonadaceae bacterium]|jgi:hypothetical protein
MLSRLITLIVLATLVGLVIWQYRTQYAVLEHHQQAQQDAASAQADQAQLQCNQSALARFQALRLDDNPTARHKGHFNPTLDQCYILIESSENSLDTDWKHITLYAADGKVFASYGWHSENGEQAADIPPYTCDVTLPTGEHRACKTEADFRNLVGAYMR